MSTSKSIEIKVGLMVGAGLALFMISTLLLGGGKKFFTSTYHLKVRFDSVTGVAPGSVVQVSGIPVGNVVGLKFAPNSLQVEVILEIEKSFQNRVTEGSVAGARTQGALGDKYIYITPGSESNPPMKEGDVLTTEKGGDIFATLAEKGDDIQNVFNVFKEAQHLLANLNADGKSAQLMPNLVKSTDELQATLAQLRLAIQGNGKDDGGLKSAMSHFESVMKKVDKGNGTLGALINDPEIHERLKAALGGSSHSTFLKNQVRETIRSEK